MKIKSTKFKDLKIISSKVYIDKRGTFREVFKKKFFKSKKFIFTCVSSSKKNVLRGMHIQTKNPQGKYLTVLKGEIYDVSVDLRKNSKNFGKYTSIIISDKSDFSFFIPKGFAHGFMCLSKQCTVNYKCSSYRDLKSEKTLAWNDPKIKINWPSKKPILSNKDNNGLNLNSF